MKTILAILVSGWAALASAEQPLAEAPASAHPKCDSWAACEVVLRQLAVGSPYGVTGEQAAFAESLHRVAPDAWSEVAALAVDDDPGLRNLAGYAMGEWTPLTDDLIPEIVAALNRDPGGWPARALARLGTPAAIEAIIDEVVRYPRGGQGTWALTQVLPAALPQVLAALEVEENDHLVVGLSDALDSLVWLHTDTENRPSLWRATVVGMVEAATEPAFNESAKVRITKVLDMSAPLEGVSLAPLYPNLHSANDELQRVTSRLLMAQGDPVMLEPLVELCAAYIRDDPDTPEELLDHAGCTHALARIGHRAAKFAPHIADLIERASGHAPTDAVEMLGFLGNDQVSPQLVRLLDSADDRIVTSALEAIWRLDAQSALLAVELVARRHWYGPVREFAARVAMALTGGDSAPVQEALALDSHEERLTGKHIWGLPLYSRVPGNRNCAHWRSGLDRGEFLPNAPADLQDAAAHIHRAVTAVRFGNGSLVGVHHGEFGGGLVFVKKGNPDHRISPENVNALIELGDGDVAALLGLAHLIDSGGWVVVLRADAMGVPDIVERIRLPSAPHGARLEGERWLVPMANGHAVWISRDLSLTQATCAAEDQVER